MKAFSKHLVLAAAATVALCSTAIAEDLGTRGTIVSLDIRSTSADAYLSWHGAMFVRAGGKNGSTTEYRWGGVACGSRTLSDPQLAMLQRALDTATPITPRFQPGQGNSNCLVGFELTP
jgi:hypothetical protein